jgi:hypothetical protein
MWTAHEITEYWEGKRPTGHEEDTGFTTLVYYP